jgi:hypothetical protein
VSAILWEKIPESKAVVVEAEQDIHPPSVPLHCKCEGVAVVAVLAAFADWQCVAVINGAGIHLHQFQTFREVAGGEFQPERRLGDEHSAVSADGVGEFAIGERNGGFQASVGRCDNEIFGTQIGNLHQGKAKQEFFHLHGLWV